MLLATYLALLGGPLPAFIQRFIYGAYFIIVPRVADLSVVETAVVGLIGAMVPLAIIYGIYTEEDAEVEEVEEPLTGWRRWFRLDIVGPIVIIALLAGLFSEAFGFRPHNLTGISMEPAYTRGDVLFTRDVSPGSIEVGDVVWFEEGQLEVIHRVIAIEGDGGELVIIARGDNNNVEDDPVPASSIKGRVVFSVPWVGNIGHWFSDLTG
jgi:signal peptidase